MYTRLMLFGAAVAGTTIVSENLLRNKRKSSLKDPDTYNTIDLYKGSKYTVLNELGCVGDPDKINGESVKRLCKDIQDIAEQDSGAAIRAFDGFAHLRANLYSENKEMPRDEFSKMCFEIDRLFNQTVKKVDNNLDFFYFNKGFEKRYNISNVR